MRKIGVAIAVLVLLGLLAAGCAGGNDTNAPASSKPEKIIVQAPMAPATAPLFKMAQDGLPGGTPMELIVYNNVEEATTRIIKNEAHFSVLPVNVASKLYNKEIDIALASVNTWGILYLVSVEDTVEQWPDLKNKELYVGAQGSTPDVLTRYLLSRSGLQLEDIKLTYLGSPEIAQMMINGMVKNAVLPEPLVTQVIMNNRRARVVRDFYADWQQFEGQAARLPQAGMIVSNSFAEAYPDSLDEFNRAYAAAMEWTLTNPDGAAQLVQANLKMPAPVFISSMERTRLQFAGAAGAKNDVLIYLGRLLDVSPDMVGGKLPDEKFFLSE
ncbi:MAG: NMT1/THI5 like protein [Pelotomaculum sp. PtaB.Bin104]|nr:MAG: NMT1/THI5 like protein [Pelotomaculum sp. PtaB.Bin104]